MTTINELQDITPEGSEIPVFLDPTPIEPIVDRPMRSPDEIIADVIETRYQILLSTGVFTAEQARAIVGL